MRAWFLTSISSIIIFSSISYIGYFHTYWTKHAKDYNRASIFIKTETCTNPRVRSTLGDFNLCDTSEEILTKTPMVAALYDVAEDLNVCVHNRCSILYVDVTKNLHKWAFVIFVISGVAFWVGIIDLKQMCDKKQLDKFSLQHKIKST